MSQKIHMLKLRLLLSICVSFHDKSIMAGCDSVWSKPENRKKAVIVKYKKYWYMVERSPNRPIIAGILD